MARTFVVLWALSVLAGAAPAADGRSPWPDPLERERFQRMELERRARFEIEWTRSATARDRLRERFDVLYYRLSLDLRNPQDRWLVGDLTARIQILSDGTPILLDLNEVMTVDSVHVGGAPAEFSHSVYDLWITPPEPLSYGDVVDVRVFYQGHPLETGFRAFGWSGHNGTPVIWSLSEPIGAREWWPCKDSPHDKADSIDVLLRVDGWMVATSNGLLVENRSEPDGSRTFHWKHGYPITTYLVSVAATDYVRIEDSYEAPTGEPMLLEHFVYPEHHAAAREDLSITAEAIDLMADRFGPYPFLREKYGHAIFPWGGAMEHQTNTSYGAALIRGDHRFDWVLIHEVAHQWWGNMTSPADWRDIWLNEGFASFSEALWFEHRGGFEDYKLYMVNIQRVTDPSGPIYDPQNLFDPNTIYNKGAWVVHMLRGVLGDRLFYEVLSEYRERTQYRSTTTHEFRTIVELVAGRPMDWFFDSWLLGTDRPDYAYSYLPFEEDGASHVAVHIDQVQRNGIFFTMPIELQIGLQGGGTVRTRVWNDPDTEDYEIRLPGPAAEVRIDPDHWILKRSTETPYLMHITTTRIPAGVQDSLYEARLRGRGGTLPHRWEPDQDMPPGMAIDPDGTLRGIAPAAGVYDFSIRLTDAAMRVDTQRYRWTVGTEADTTQTPPDTVLVELPGRLSMKAGPIPASERISFRLQHPPGQSVDLEIFDIHGRKVRDLWRGPAPAGEIAWDGKDDRDERVPSGIYLARAKGSRETITRRVVWLWKR